MDDDDMLKLREKEIRLECYGKALQGFSCFMDSQIRAKKAGYSVNDQSISMDDVLCKAKSIYEWVKDGK